MNSLTTKYLLLEKNGTIPHSTLMNPSQGNNSPIIQALNMGFLPYPMPPAIHFKDMQSKMKLTDVQPSQLEILKVFPGQCGHPIAVSARFWYNIYGFSWGPIGEWAYDWEKKKSFPWKTKAKSFTPYPLLPFPHTQIDGTVTIPIMMEVMSSDKVLPVASEVEVDEFLQGVEREIEEGLRESGWPEESFDSVLPVPGNIRQSSQLIKEEEGGKCHLIKAEKRELNKVTIGVTQQRKHCRIMPYPAARRLKEVLKALTSSKLSSDSSTSQTSANNKGSAANNSELSNPLSPELRRESSPDLPLSPLNLEYPTTNSMDSDE
ncbi:hypothetical protein EDD85DRAFT_962925 [Armillaria nabsnona]|nr:hypothetical protein EDD85DRAFT_962925 [Armillaria nabsnona]